MDDIDNSPDYLRSFLVHAKQARKNTISTEEKTESVIVQKEKKEQPTKEKTTKNEKKEQAKEKPLTEKDLGENIDTSDWKTYRNEEYGFEVRYKGKVWFKEWLIVNNAENGEKWIEKNTSSQKRANYAEFKFCDSSAPCVGGMEGGISLSIRKECNNYCQVRLQENFLKKGNVIKDFFPSGNKFDALVSKNEKGLINNVFFCDKSKNICYNIQSDENIVHTLGFLQSFRLLH